MTISRPLLTFGLFTLLAACSLRAGLKDGCTASTDCSDGNSCSFGHCVDSRALLDAMDHPAETVLAQCN